MQGRSIGDTTLLAIRLGPENPTLTLLLLCQPLGAGLFGGGNIRAPSARRSEASLSSIDSFILIFDDRLFSPYAQRVLCAAG